MDLPHAGPVYPFWQVVGWQGKEKQTECTSRTLVHAHQQLHPHGNAGVPAQRQQADVTGHNRWAQQVLHRGRAVRVPIEDLKSGKRVKIHGALYHTSLCTFIIQGHESRKTGPVC